MMGGGYPSLFVLLLAASLSSAYRIPSEDLIADVEIHNLENPATIYFTYRVNVVLGNSVQFPVEGSTADGDKRLTIEPAVGGPKTKFVRQYVTRTQEGGKSVIKLIINSTVRNTAKKIKYTGTTTITYRAGQEIQWFSDHEAKQVLNYKGEGCDPDDIECNPNPPPPVKVVPACTPNDNSLSVVCQAEEYSPNNYRYNCVGVDPCLITISNEHILWLNGPSGQNLQLDVVIPNYRIEELIRAALKASSAGSTNINILLKKPEQTYDVQAQDAGPLVASPPVVNLEYEAADRPVSLHYPTDKQYNPLSGPIKEPGASRPY